MRILLAIWHQSWPEKLSRNWLEPSHQSSQRFLKLPIFFTVSTMFPKSFWLFPSKKDNIFAIERLIKMEDRGGVRHFLVRQVLSHDGVYPHSKTSLLTSGQVGRIWRKAQHMGTSREHQAFHHTLLWRWRNQWNLTFIIIIFTLISDHLYCSWSYKTRRAHAKTNHQAFPRSWARKLVPLHWGW